MPKVEISRILQYTVMVSQLFKPQNLQHNLILNLVKLVTESLFSEIWIFRAHWNKFQFFAGAQQSCLLWSIIQKGVKNQKIFPYFFLGLTKVNYTQCSVTCGSGYQDVLYKCRGDFGTCTYSGNVFYLGDNIYALNEICYQNVSCRKLKIFIFFLKIQRIHSNVFLKRSIPIVSE